MPDARESANSGPDKSPTYWSGHERLRIDFKCGCFTSLWVESERIQGGISNCPAHEKAGGVHRELGGKVVYNVVAK